MSPPGGRSWDAVPAMVVLAIAMGGRRRGRRTFAPLAKDPAMG